MTAEAGDRRARDPMTGPSSPRLPIGVQLGTIGIDIAWWLESAARLDEAGYAGRWCWDHFVSRGIRTDPVLECWTTLSSAIGVTRRASLGPFVANVMNRHPALLARMAATFQEASGGRLVLALGIGGFPAELDAYGMPVPGTKERLACLEEAIAVLRALWSGGPVSRESRFYPLREAIAFPVPRPAPPLLVGADRAAGVRLAARVGDGWTTFASAFEAMLPTYLEALEAAGRRRSDMTVLVAFGGGGAGRDALRASPWIADPAAEWSRWANAGADGAVVTARTTSDVDALVAAAGRW